MLFQKLCTENHLYHAWRQVKAKNSAGGIDGFSVLDFEYFAGKNRKINRCKNRYGCLLQDLFGLLHKNCLSTG